MRWAIAAPSEVPVQTHGMITAAAPHATHTHTRAHTPHSLEMGL
jgi:hypothetical protein